MMTTEAVNLLISILRGLLDEASKNGMDGAAALAIRVQLKELDRRLLDDSYFSEG